MFLTNYFCPLFLDLYVLYHGLWESCAIIFNMLWVEILYYPYNWLRVAQTYNIRIKISFYCLYEKFIGGFFVDCYVPREIFEDGF